MAVDTEFLLKLSKEELTAVAKALDQNWTIQLILSGIGVALVFNIGNLPTVVSEYFSHREFDLKPAAAILLALLLYHFMKFGHLLTAFVEARQLSDELLREYLGPSAFDDRHRPLRETTSYFEGYYSPVAFGGRGPLIAVYYVATGVIVSAGQAAALSLLLSAYKANVWSIATLLVSGGIIGLLYREYWRSKKDQPGTTAMVLASSGAAIVLFFVFYFLGSPALL